jgi:hypothetical protein
MRLRLGRWTCRALAAGGALALVAVGVAFARRPPEVPNPNGYDVLSSLASKAPPEAHNMPLTNRAMVGAFAAAHSILLDRVTAAVAMDSKVPVEFSTRWIPRRAAALVNLRHLEDTVLVCAADQEFRGDLAAATEARLTAVRLGQQLGRGGLLIDFMIGSAIQMRSLAALSNSASGLSESACRTALDRLGRLEHEWEPLKAAAPRERRWMLFGSGWWREWDSAKALPAALWSPGKAASFFGSGSPADRESALRDAYAAVMTAIKRRLETLTGGNIKVSPNP